MTHKAISYVVQFDKNGKSFGFAFAKEKPKSLGEGESFVAADQIDPSKPLMWQRDKAGNVEQLESVPAIKETTKGPLF